MAGLESTGFVALTLNEVRDRINEKMRARFGPSIDLSDDSVLGRIVGIFSEMIATQWELAESIYSSQDPDKAVDQALEAIAALTGTLKNDASPSTVPLTLTGTPLTSVLAGSRAKTASTSVLFETTADAVIVAATAWASSAAYVTGDRVTNDSRVYLCVADGTSAGSGGPTGDGEDIVDGTVLWDFLGDGTGFVDATGRSVDDGPIVAVARDITVIDTPVGGWQSVVNITDATPGRLTETNEELRVRREQELAGSGSTSLDAIRADLLKLDGVTAVTVFMNVTSTTDADGLPPKSVEALVQGGVDQDIFDTLLTSVAGGIETHGNTVGSATDSQGISHVRKFSRPVEVDIYVSVTLVKDPSTYPADGDAQVKAKIVAYGNAQSTGKNAVSSAIGAQCFGVPGVLEVPLPLISTTPGPVSSATIAIAVRELAVYDTSRISVSTSDGTP